MTEIRHPLRSARPAAPADPRLHYLEPLRTTPFHPRIGPLNRLWDWVPWAGYVTAGSFGDEALEHSAIRNAATLFDLSPMIKVRLRGPGAAAMLDRVTLRHVARMPVGSVQYTAWCDGAGKVLDDGTLFRLGEGDFRLCSQERHMPWLLDSARGFDVTLEEETEAVAGLSLQGPCAAAVLSRAGLEVNDLRPFRLTVRDGITISRTGFTGDLGYELWVAPEGALALWDRLAEAGEPFGLRPIGMSALDVARIEAGLLLAGKDFVPAEHALREDRALSPFELGLDWMIVWDKGHFNGRRALLREREKGSDWVTVGLDVAGNVSAEGAVLYHRQTREVGQVTSGCWSPLLKRSIGIAQVRRPFDGRDDLWAEIYAWRELRYVKRMERVRIVPRPFLVLDRRRATPPLPVRSPGD